MISIKQRRFPPSAQQHVDLLLRSPSSVSNSVSRQTSLLQTLESRQPHVVPETVSSSSSAASETLVTKLSSNVSGETTA